MIRAERVAFAARMAPVVQRAHQFSGWDFGGIDVSHPDGREPWGYETLAQALVASASRVLDLGTGGGEVFSRILEGARAAAVASEEWHVNAPLAAERLRPWNVKVVHASSLVSPFRSGAFDLVLSRHEAVDPSEVDRILAPGGTFLTQQVVPDDLPELRAYFPRKTIHPAHDVEYPAAFKELGYAVRYERAGFPAFYRKLEDLVFLLLVTPWDIADLDLEADAAALLAVERDLSTPLGIELTEGRYLLEARKPR